MKTSGILKKSLRNYKVARHRPKVWILPSCDVGYVKITKVASSSVELALARYIAIQSTGEDAPEMDRAMIRKYADQYAIHTDLKDLPTELRPEFVFSFVRNPLARLHSSYVNKIEDVRNSGEGESIFWNHGITLDMSFEEFIERLVEIPDHKIDRHLRSQSSVLCDEGKIMVDYVGRFENMREDWNVLVEQHNLPYLPHKNRSSKSKESSPVSPYTRETAILIADRYDHDINVFGYGDDVQRLIDSLK